MWRFLAGKVQTASGVGRAEINGCLKVLAQQGEASKRATATPPLGLPRTNCLPRRLVDSAGPKPSPSLAGSLRLGEQTSRVMPVSSTGWRISSVTKGSPKGSTSSRTRRRRAPTVLARTWTCGRTPE